MVSQVFLQLLFLIVEYAAREVLGEARLHQQLQHKTALSHSVRVCAEHWSLLHFKLCASLPAWYNHAVSNTTQAIVQDVENISLVGSAGHATVQYNGKLSFTFWKVLHLRISCISFIGCGLRLAGDLQFIGTEIQSSYRDQINVALLFVECSSVVLKNVTVMESYGYGLLGYNMVMTELKYCLFYHNYWRPQLYKHSSPTKNYLPNSKAGGNALFTFDYSGGFHSKSTTLNILHSEFAHERNLQMYLFMEVV